jgi:hypothetical protein
MPPSAETLAAPAFEVADILRIYGDRFLQQRGPGMNRQQRKVFRAILHCRTPVLGTHVDACPKCGYQIKTFNSCRNRHCPKCQARSRRRWIAAREREVLDTPYFHVVFTVPQELNVLALQNQRLFYSLMFTASARASLEVAANPDRLGAEIGILSILHTWGQNLHAHPHIHCVIPQGGISPDHTHWIQPRYRYFLPKKVLSRVFRGKLTSGLKRLYRRNNLRLHGSISHLTDPKQFAQFLRTLHKHDWVVDVRPAFGGPRQVIRYLGRYTHRVAISNHRILNFDGEKVTFLWKDYAHGGRRGPMTLHADEFLRRFFLHVLPKGFVRIRNFGFLANRFRTQSLELCKELLAEGSASSAENDGEPTQPDVGCKTWPCPCCGTPMVIIRTFEICDWIEAVNTSDA